MFAKIFGKTNSKTNIIDAIRPSVFHDTFVDNRIHSLTGIYYLFINLLLFIFIYYYYLLFMYIYYYLLLFIFIIFVSVILLEFCF